MTYEEVFQRAESRGETNAFSRIDDTHPVDIFVGLEAGDRAVMIICKECPPDTPNLSAISVGPRSRSDGRWALVLRLRRPELKALFSKLVLDLDVSTRQNPQDPGGTVIARLSRWQRLLSPGNSGLMSDDALRGMCAELDFLLNEAIPKIGLRPAVLGWEGPFDAPKDFNFDKVMVEVKAVRSNPVEYRISSLEQLTDHPVKSLFLWVRTVEITEANEPDPKSASYLVSRLREAAASDPVASEALDIRLLSAGYEDSPQYASRILNFGPIVCMKVHGNFPRLQRATVPSAITRCEYRINAAACQSFKVQDWNHG